MAFARVAIHPPTETCMYDTCIYIRSRRHLHLRMDLSSTNQLIMFGSGRLHLPLEYVGLLSTSPGVAEQGSDLRHISIHPRLSLEGSALSTGKACICVPSVRESQRQESSFLEPDQ